MLGGQGGICAHFSTAEHELENKLKSVLTHEVHMEQEIIALHDELKKIYYEDMKLICKLEWNLLHTSRYFSRKSWRMEILMDYMVSMQVAIDLAFGG